MKKLIIVLIAIFVLVSCSSMPANKIPYDARLSRAQNIWRASEMSGLVEDQKIPKEQMGSILNGATGQVLDRHFYMSAERYTGVSGKFMSGLSLAVFFLKPDDDNVTQRNFFWLKDTGQSAEEAQKTMFNAFIEAAKATVIEQGYSVEYVEERYTGQKGLMSETPSYVAVFMSGKDCVGARSCFVQLTLPTLTQSPGIQRLDMLEGSYWRCNNKNAKSILVGWKKTKSKETKMIPDIETAIKISEKMPDYFYMYFGPKKLLDPNGEPIPFPLIIEKGQVLMFVVPK